MTCRCCGRTALGAGRNNLAGRNQRRADATLWRRLHQQREKAKAARRGTPSTVHLSIALSVAVFSAISLTTLPRATGQATTSLPEPPLRTPNPSSTSNRLVSVSTESATDAWAVGWYKDDATGARNTLILHWTGTSWSQIPSPNPSSISNKLFGVSAVSATDAWAVGHYKDDARTGARNTLTLHWNGTSWSQVPSPNPSTYNRLESVSAESATDAWAIGYRYPASNDTLILHWDGTRWSKVRGPDTSGIFIGVSADSATNAWAVGTTGTRTRILHWNGMDWSEVQSPNPRAINWLFGVSAVSTTDAWAVGGGASYRLQGLHRTLILHWDGTSWSHLSSPNPGITQDLNGVSAESATDVWAVGSAADDYSGPINTMVLHWDGRTWSQVTSPNPSSTSNRLVSVSTESARDAWAVGDYKDDPTGARNTLILHWDGTSWSQTPR